MADRQQISAAVKAERERVSPTCQPGQNRTARLDDLIIACSLLAFTLPLIIIIAVAIKCESAGPVLSRKELIGSGGRRQALLKFRTTAERPEPDWQRGWRLTRMGQFLRYTRMDELPQLLNVLLGEVSLAELFDW